RLSPLRRDALAPAFRWSGVSGGNGGPLALRRGDVSRGPVPSPGTTDGGFHCRQPEERAVRGAYTFRNHLLPRAPTDVRRTPSTYSIPGGAVCGVPLIGPRHAHDHTRSKARKKAHKT